MNEKASVLPIVIGILKILQFLDLQNLCWFKKKRIYFFHRWGRNVQRPMDSIFQSISESFFSNDKNRGWMESVALNYLECSWRLRSGVRSDASFPSSGTFVSLCESAFGLHCFFLHNLFVIREFFILLRFHGKNRNFTFRVRMHTPTVALCQRRWS